jgi:integrase/recombinase XerC
MRWTEATNRYLRWMDQYRGASPDTIVSYTSTLGNFGRSLPGDDLKHFTPGPVSQWAESLAAGGMKARTIRQKLVALSSFAKWAMRQPVGRGYLLQDNPLVRVERPRAQPAKSNLLRPGELGLLLLVPCRGYEALARDVFIDTLLRVSEVANANVADFDGISIAVKLKGGRFRPVPIARELAERIKDSLLDRGVPAGHEPLLVNSEGQRWRRSSLTEMIARLGRKAGITRVRVGPHMLARHTNNVIGQRAGLDVLTRAGLLNHQGTQTSISYDHLIADETAIARDVLREARRAYIGEAKLSP